MTSIKFSDIDVAVAHWHVNAWGGAEYLVTRLADAFGEDIVYTMGHPTPNSPNPYGDITFQNILPSLSLPAIRRMQCRIGRVFEYGLWEDVDWRTFGDPDVLVTSGATSRAVITPDDTLHINYCHSTPRWFYDLYHDRKDSTVGHLARPLVRFLRIRDMAVDPRVDHYLVNSPIIERRLWKYYKRDSEIMYPPVDLDACRPGDDCGYYLHLGRLDEEKGVPEIVSAFCGTDYELRLAGGNGDIEESVRHQIDRENNIEYYGFVSEEQKYNLLANCRALVFNGRSEDFGIVPIEANACDKAVLARNEGFPEIFIQEGKNGFTHNGTSDGIVKAIEKLEDEGISGEPRKQAETFSTIGFEEKIKSMVIREYDAFTDLVGTKL